MFLHICFQFLHSSISPFIPPYLSSFLPLGIFLFESPFLPSPLSSFFPRYLPSFLYIPLYLCSISPFLPLYQFSFLTPFLTYFFLYFSLSSSAFFFLLPSFLSLFIHSSVSYFLLPHLPPFLISLFFPLYIFLDFLLHYLTSSCIYSSLSVFFHYFFILHFSGIFNIIYVNIFVLWQDV
jgi:hypothetical protein